MGHINCPASSKARLPPSTLRRAAYSRVPNVRSSPFRLLGCECLCQLANMMPQPMGCAWLSEPWEPNTHPYCLQPQTGLSLQPLWTIACSSVWRQSRLLPTAPLRTLPGHSSRCRLLLHTITCTGVAQVRDSGQWRVCVTARQRRTNSMMRLRAGTRLWTPTHAHRWSCVAWSARVLAGQPTPHTRIACRLPRLSLIATHIR